MSKIFWNVAGLLLLSMTCAAAQMPKEARGAPHVAPLDVSGLVVPAAKPAKTTKGVDRGVAPRKAKPHKLGGSVSSFFHNDRLKIYQGVTTTIPWLIAARGGSFEVKGVLKSESSDPNEALVFPEEDTIICSKSDMTCQVLEVDLGGFPPLVQIFHPSESSYHINRWDAHGLMASINPSATELPPSSRRCNTRVLTMTFQEGEVTLTQIPTHAKGCSIYKTAQSYRLELGWEYYVVTTPNGKVKPLIRK